MAPSIHNTGVPLPNPPPNAHAVRAKPDISGIIFHVVSAAVMAVAAVAIVVVVTSLDLWVRQFAGYHDGTLSGIYLALVVATATVTMVSATRGTRAALAHQ